MATWFEHPKYVAVRDRLIQYLRSDRYRFRRLEPVLFLCGAAGSPRRDRLRDYLRKHKPWLSLFYAERVWDLLASQAGLSALKMESELATLADLVLIIVESPGTFAELGAFSLNDELRRKLLPIVDVKYRQTSSFIATGPLKWIDEESDFQPTIYVPLTQILQAVDDVEQRIARIERTGAMKVTDLAASPKHLLFFLCDLIAVIHPATLEMVEFYLAQIVRSLPVSDLGVPVLLGLATAMDLLRAKDLDTDGQCQIFFSPGRPSAVARPYHYSDLPSQRAAHVSVLLTIPQAREALHALEIQP